MKPGIIIAGEYCESINAASRLVKIKQKRVRYLYRKFGDTIPNKLLTEVEKTKRKKKVISELALSYIDNMVPGELWVYFEGERLPRSGPHRDIANAILQSNNVILSRKRVPGKMRFIHVAKKKSKETRS